MENTNSMGIGTTENTQAQDTPKKINWKDLTDFVDRPVYEAETGKWHILRGYKQYGNKKEVFLSDVKEACEFEILTLYPTDEGLINAHSFVNDGKKFGSK